MKLAPRICVLCAVAAQADAEPLGRLFFTPEQRQLLERQRLYGSIEADSALRLDGIVQRSGTRPTVWINGMPQREARSGEIAALRVGESIDPATREKRDVVPSGSIKPSSRH